MFSIELRISLADAVEIWHVVNHICSGLQHIPAVRFILSVNASDHTWFVGPGVVIEIFVEQRFYYDRPTCKNEIEKCDVVVVVEQRTGVSIVKTEEENWDRENHVFPEKVSNHFRVSDVGQSPVVEN